MPVFEAAHLFGLCILRSLSHGKIISYSHENSLARILSCFTSPAKRGDDELEVLNEDISQLSWRIPLPSREERKKLVLLHSNFRKRYLYSSLTDLPTF